MTIIDISRTISEDMEIYPGDPRFKLERLKELKKDGVLLSKATMGLHTGTHVDAPAHFVDGSTVDGLPALITGKALYTDKLQTADIIILNRELQTDEANELIEGGVRVVGVGTLSVGSREVHKQLLNNNIIIIEGLDLSGVEHEEYELICMALKIKGAEAAPARCVLKTAD